MRYLIWFSCVIFCLNLWLPRSKSVYLCRSGPWNELDPYGHIRQRCVVTWFALLPGLLKVLDLRLEGQGDAHFSFVDKPPLLPVPLPVPQASAKVDEEEAVAAESRKVERRVLPENNKEKSTQINREKKTVDKSNDDRRKTSKESYQGDFMEFEDDQDSDIVYEDDLEYDYEEKTINVPVAKYIPKSIYSRWTPLQVPIPVPIFKFGVKQYKQEFSGKSPFRFRPRFTRHYKVKRY